MIWKRLSQRGSPLNFVSAVPRGANLLLDPLIGTGETVFERNLRFPPEHLAQAAVVGIAAAHALRTVDEIHLDTHARNVGDHLRELTDGNEAILSEIERRSVAGAH